jgi:TrpR family transcriptional regulator, trp operon repressor
MRVAIERTEEDEEAFRDISRLLAGVKDQDLILQFLEELLTPNEVTELSRRWRLVKLLHEGLPQREIATRLHLSLCKITRGSKELKRPDSAFRQILEMRKK